MITDDDVKKLKDAFKDTFATKDDLVAMEKRQGTKFDSIHRELKQIKGSLNEVIDVFDRRNLYHHSRIAELEKRSGMDEQPSMPPIKN